MVTTEEDYNSTTAKKGTLHGPGLTCTRYIHTTLLQYSWLPDVLRLQGTVCFIVFRNLIGLTPGQILPKIFGPVMTVTLFATAAAYVWSKGVDITLTNSVVPLFSVVVCL